MVTPPDTLLEATSRTQEVAREVIARQVERTDSGVWPEVSIRALQAAGLAGLVVPREYGGSGLGLRAVAGVCEIIGQVCGSTALCFGMHQVGSAVLAAKATERQAKEYLEPIAAGEHLTTLALSEPGTGSQFWLPETQVRQVDGGGWQVDGGKMFVTNGSKADSYVVSTVAADPSAPPGQFSCVVVPSDADGLSFAGSWDGVGMRGNSSLAARMDGVRLEPWALLGSPGDQIWYVFELIAPYFLTAMAGTYLGVAQAALNEAVEHLKERRHSHTGRTLAAEPVLQHKVGVAVGTGAAGPTTRLLGCRGGRGRGPRRPSGARVRQGDGRRHRGRGGQRGDDPGRRDRLPRALGHRASPARRPGRPRDEPDHRHPEDLDRPSGPRRTHPRNLT